MYQVFFGVFTHFSKFSRHAWEKIPKMLVFTRVYVCVKAKLTFVSFFLEFFFEPFPYNVYKVFQIKQSRDQQLKLSNGSRLVLSISGVVQ